MSDRLHYVNGVTSHAAYADPIRGGFGGYQAACWDCDFRAETIYDDKNEARREAIAHMDANAVEPEPRYEPAGYRYRWTIALAGPDDWRWSEFDPSPFLLADVTEVQPLFVVAR